MRPIQDLISLIPLASPNRPRLTVQAPFTGQIIGEIPAAQAADVELAIQRARVGQVAWASRPVKERCTIIDRFQGLVWREREFLLDLLQAEGGKARRYAVGELLEVIGNAAYYVAHAPRFLHPKRRLSTLPWLTQTREYHHPLGVVGIIAPWNYPLTTSISDVIPALLAGNSVILKPSELTTFTALAVVKLLYEAGLPPEVLQVLSGYGAEVGPPLVAAIDGLCFTGSTAVGKRLAQQAGERLIKFSMELGGKNPMLVLADAALDDAVAGAVRGCFDNVGQLCISIERLYIQRRIFEPFMQQFVQRTRQLKLSGQLGDETADLGSLISANHLAKVQGHVQDAVAQGARLWCGGQARPDLGPYFFEPTILTEVQPSMKLFQEETFGPVVAVYPFDNVEEVITWANDSVYGLNASIWTRNIRLAQAIAPRLQCGTVNINESYAATWSAYDAPMGGMKQSGVGRRHGQEGLLKYTQAQTVSWQRILPIEMYPQIKYAHFMAGATALVLFLRYLRYKLS